VNKPPRCSIGHGTRSKLVEIKDLYQPKKTLLVRGKKSFAAYAFSYPFTTHHDVSHGRAVWLTMPAIFQCHLDAKDSSVQDLHGPSHFKATMDKLTELLRITDKSQACQTLKDFVTSLGLETDMSKLGAASEEQRTFLSRQVNLERMGNNPVQLSDKDIARIFDLKGKN
jgi:alcohol dehydrogenase